MIPWWRKDLECPTAEEKIVALEAKLNSTVKKLNKKVSGEWSKNKGADKKSGSNKSKKNNGKSNERPKTWPAPAPKGDRMEAKYKDQTWYW
jgi:hypothetical protein